MAKVDWNASEYENGRPPMEVLPKGRYLLLITDSEAKKTKNGDGKYIEWTFQVMAPSEFKGRKLWKRMNVHNPSEVAERIGREEFNALCIAAKVDKSRASDTAMLHNKIVIGAVSIRDGQRGDMNEIDAFEEASPEAAARAREAAKQTTGNRPAQQPRQQEPRREPARETTTTDVDDDIPF